MSYKQNPKRLDSVLKTSCIDMLPPKVASDIANFMDIVFVWQKVVGNHISRTTEVVMFRRGVITVKVQHAAWRNELFLRKNKIIDKVNKALKDEIVVDILFK